MWKYTVLLCIAFRLLRFNVWGKEQTVHTIPTHVLEPRRALRAVWPQELQRRPAPAPGCCPTGNRGTAFLPRLARSVSLRPGTLRALSHRNEALRYKWWRGVNKIVPIVKTLKCFSSYTRLWWADGRSNPPFTYNRTIWKRLKQRLFSK